MRARQIKKLALACGRDAVARIGAMVRLSNFARSLVAKTGLADDQPRCSMR